MRGHAEYIKTIIKNTLLQKGLSESVAEERATAKLEQGMAYFKQRQDAASADVSVAMPGRANTIHAKASSDLYDWAKTHA